MEISFTPVLKIAGIGALAYGFGSEIKARADQVALIWIIAEAAMQVFLYFQKSDPYQTQYPMRAVVGGFACLYLANQLKIVKVAHVVLSMIVFTVFPYAFDCLRINPSIKI